MRFEARAADCKVDRCLERQQRGELVSLGDSRPPGLTNSPRVLHDVFNRQQSNSPHLEFTRLRFPNTHVRKTLSAVCDPVVQVGQDLPHLPETEPPACPASLYPPFLEEIQHAGKGRAPLLWTVAVAGADRSEIVDARLSRREVDRRVVVHVELRTSRPAPGRSSSTGGIADRRTLSATCW